MPVRAALMLLVTFEPLLVHGSCTEGEPACHISIGGVYRDDCADIYERAISDFVGAVNALNGGKGVGLHAGHAAPHYFYQLAFTFETYRKDAVGEEGLAKARKLFPRFDTHAHTCVTSTHMPTHMPTCPPTHA